ncbi:hypothetical protein VR46_04430, partial [Streptomyces sp. NRRL S-444]
ATDFALVDSLVGRAGEIAGLAPRVLNQEALARAVASGEDQLAGDRLNAARRTAEEAVGRLAEWRDSLVLPPVAGPSYELESGSVRDAAVWSRAHVAPLRAAERLIRVVEEIAAAGAGVSAAPGTWTLAAARASVYKVRAARAAAAEFESSEHGDRALLADLYRGR